MQQAFWSGLNLSTRWYDGKIEMWMTLCVFFNVFLLNPKWQSIEKRDHSRHYWRFEIARQNPEYFFEFVVYIQILSIQSIIFQRSKYEMVIDHLINFVKRWHDLAQASESNPCHCYRKRENQSTRAEMPIAFFFVPQGMLFFSFRSRMIVCRHCSASE